MFNRVRSIDQIVSDQVQKWEMGNLKDAPPKLKESVITVSRQLGSLGQYIAADIAKKLNYDLFDRRLIKEISLSANKRLAIVNTLDENTSHDLIEWVNSFSNEHSFFMDDFITHLMRITSAINKHGGAVIVGRGVNFILPRKDIFAVRFIAPFDTRVKRVAEDLKISEMEARREVIQMDSNQRSFARKHYNVKIGDADHYDMVINTESLSIEQASQAVVAVIRSPENSRK